MVSTYIQTDRQIDSQTDRQTSSSIVSPSTLSHHTHFLNKPIRRTTSPLPSTTTYHYATLNNYPEHTDSQQLLYVILAHSLIHSPQSTLYPPPLRHFFTPRSHPLTSSETRYFTICHCYIDRSIQAHLGISKCFIPHARDIKRKTLDLGHLNSSNTIATTRAMIPLCNMS